MSNDENEKENSKDWLSKLSNAIIIIEYTARLVSHLSNIYTAWQIEKSTSGSTHDAQHPPNPQHAPSAPHEDLHESGVVLPPNIDRLAQQYDRVAETENNACKICLTNEIKTINLNCGHLVFCFICAKQYTSRHLEMDSDTVKCPICRQALKEIKQIFD